MVLAEYDRDMFEAGLKCQARNKALIWVLCGTGLTLAILCGMCFIPGFFAYGDIAVVLGMVGTVPAIVGVCRLRSYWRMSEQAKTVTIYTDDDGRLFLHLDEGHLRKRGFTHKYVTYVCRRLDSYSFTKQRLVLCGEFDWFTKGLASTIRGRDTSVLVWRSYGYDSQLLPYLDQLIADGRAEKPVETP